MNWLDWGWSELIVEVTSSTWLRFEHTYFHDEDTRQSKSSASDISDLLWTCSKRSIELFVLKDEILDLFHQLLQVWIDLSSTMKGPLQLSSLRLSFGRSGGRAPDSHDWRYIVSNHLSEKGIITLPYDDYHLPYKPKPSQKLRGSGLYGVEWRMHFR